MQIKVIMSDADYQRIIAANGKRVRGSIAMNSPQEFDFRAFATETPSTQAPNRILNMKHGRATVAPDRVRLYIIVKRADEAAPIDIVFDESQQAINFMEGNLLA